MPALCELLGNLFSQEVEFRPDPAKQAAGLRTILADPEVGRILVLRNGTAVIGMVGLLFVPSTALGGRVAILEDLIVHPNHRGGGSGSRLLEAAVELARSAGCLRITLLTDSDNEAVQRFYLRNGFSPSAMLPMRMMLDPTANEI